MKKIKVAVIGLGNCAKSLIEGVALYNCRSDRSGLGFEEIGGYKPEDIEFVLAYDVDKRKVGKEITEAIYAKPNCSMNLDVNVYDIDAVTSKIKVKRGPVLDGVAPHMMDYSENEAFRVSSSKDASFDEVVKDLKENKIDVLLNYLPVGSQEATEFYINASLEAKVPFVNCMPVFIVSDSNWQKKIINAGIPAIGDDMKSAIGASIISSTLQELFLKRGANVDVHYQDNVGGNTDFLNMQDQERLKSKKTSKENVIKNQNIIAGVQTKPNSIAAGPANYFSALGDNKRASFLITGTIFGGAPFEFSATLSCQDSPNSAGVVIDAIRFLQVSKELRIIGSVFGPSAWTQKTPPMDLRPGKAYDECINLANRDIPPEYVSDGAGNFIYENNILS